MYYHHHGHLLSPIMFSLSRVLGVSEQWIVLLAVIILRDGLWPKEIERRPLIMTAREKWLTRFSGPHNAARFTPVQLSKERE